MFRFLKKWVLALMIAEGLQQAPQAQQQQVPGTCLSDSCCASGAQGCLHGSCWHAFVVQWCGMRRGLPWLQQPQGADGEAAYTCAALHLITANHKQWQCLPSIADAPFAACACTEKGVTCSARSRAVVSKLLFTRAEHM
jgi:hypothetical protein